MYLQKKGSRKRKLKLREKRASTTDNARICVGSKGAFKCNVCQACEISWCHAMKTERGLERSSKRLLVDYDNWDHTEAVRKPENSQETRGGAGGGCHIRAQVRCFVCSDKCAVIYRQGTLCTLLCTSFVLLVRLRLCHMQT